MTLSQVLHDLNSEVQYALSLSDAEIRDIYGLSDGATPAHHSTSNKIMGLADEYSKKLGGVNYNWSYNEVMAWIKMHCMAPRTDKWDGPLLRNGRG